MTELLGTNIIGLLARVVLVCSLLHSFMPPWESLQDFPKAQKYYKLGLYVIGYIAINGRSTIYPSISTQNGTKISQVAKQTGEDTKTIS